MGLNMANGAYKWGLFSFPCSIDLEGSTSTCCAGLWDPLAMSLQSSRLEFLSRCYRDRCFIVLLKYWGGGWGLGELWDLSLRFLLSYFHDPMGRCHYVSLLLSALLLLRPTYFSLLSLFLLPPRPLAVMRTLTLRLLLLRLRGVLAGEGPWRQAYAPTLIATQWTSCSLSP